MTTLFVLCGPPGAGKSTWAARRAGATVVSTDDIRVLGASADRVFPGLYRHAENALRASRDVVVDACNLRSSARKGWQRLARRCGARAVLVLMQTAPQLCILRDAARGDLKSPVNHKVAQELFQESQRSVSREGWDHVLSIRGDR